ncbi:7796_t:CDS:1 [Gigaspora rosea]|nr:7796_t:CDS:1 [Gigaspora rosea]
MPKTKSSSVKSIKLRRKKNIHYFETSEFKEKLKLSIENNLPGFFSNKNDFNFKHTIEQLLAPCKKTRGKRNRITRPQNAFILYRKDIQSEIVKENPNVKLEQISKIVGEKWANASDETKNRYTILAELCNRVHRDIFPNYKFIPKSKQRANQSLNIMPGESEVDSLRPWSLLSSIVAFGEPLPSLNENIPKETCESVNMLQETQFTTESQYLNSAIELNDLHQMNEQFERNHLTYLDYEIQSTENFPYSSNENVSPDTILPQDFESYSFATLNYNSFRFDTDLDFGSYDQLCDILDLNNLNHLNNLNNLNNLNYFNHLNGFNEYFT